MVQIHPQARTTPAVRAEIARSTEPASVVAKRYGISDETVRKWRKRGEQAVQDRSSRPKRLAWRMNEDERAIICAVRRATGFALDDLTFVLRHRSEEPTSELQSLMRISYAVFCLQKKTLPQVKL